jgi:hypothetical protein
MEFKLLCPAHVFVAFPDSLWHRGVNV